MNRDGERKERKVSIGVCENESGGEVSKADSD